MTNSKPKLSTLENQSKYFPFILQLALNVSELIAKFEFKTQHTLA